MNQDSAPERQVTLTAKQLRAIAKLEADHPEIDVLMVTELDSSGGLHNRLAKVAALRKHDGQGKPVEWLVRADGEVLSAVGPGAAA